MFNAFFINDFQFEILGIPNKKLRINAYGGLIPFVDQEPSTFTVQCAKITHMDSEVCGGMIHTVSYWPKK